MTRPAILVHSAAIASKLGDCAFGDAPIYGPESILKGVSAELASSVEILISGGEPLDTRLVDALPRLKLVACFSTGYAGIDLAHLRSRGIALTSAAGINAHDVADHALALLLALWHGVPAADRLVRGGGWRQGVAPRRSLRGRRAGIVGLGRIGDAVARRLAAHEMAVRWWGPRDKPGAAFARAPSLAALAAESDVLVVTSRATQANAGQIDASILHALGSEGVLVNVSRGFLVDEDALIAALRTGALGGAALDVFVDEPTEARRWRDVPNVVLTPHLAGFTTEAGVDMIGQLEENVRRHLRGEPLFSRVEDPV